MKTIGVLNLQGAVSEHISILAKLDNINPILVKHPQDFNDLDGLIIPGGESTAISRLIKENELSQSIKQFAESGKGIFGTCAGLVLCSKAAAHNLGIDKAVMPLGLIEVTVQRNGFGPQVNSFETFIDIKKIGNQIPAVFIRAPYILSLSADVVPLAYIDELCVMAQSNNILVCSFHPELTGDLRIIRYFIKYCC